jgi:hypothetical protein
MVRVVVSFPLELTVSDEGEALNVKPGGGRLMM